MMTIVDDEDDNLTSIVTQYIYILRRCFFSFNDIKCVNVRVIYWVWRLRGANTFVRGLFFIALHLKTKFPFCLRNPNRGQREGRSLKCGMSGPHSPPFGTATDRAELNLRGVIVLCSNGCGTSEDMLWKLDALQSFIVDLHWPDEVFAEHLSHRLKLMSADMIEAAAKRSRSDISFSRSQRFINIARA